jgi:Holliday junction resolvase RusA-like endonuclease
MITILGQVPSKSNGYKIGNNRLYKSKELKEYEHFFLLKMLEHRYLFLEPIKEKFSIEIHVYFQSNRSDLDNAAKIILDCLQTCGVIENDRLCYELKMKKFVDKDNPRIEFQITEIAKIGNLNTSRYF